MPSTIPNRPTQKTRIQYDTCDSSHILDLNPAHLDPHHRHLLIRRFPQIPLVLLRQLTPFLRETSSGLPLKLLKQVRQSSHRHQHTAPSLVKDLLHFKSPTGSRRGNDTAPVQPCQAPRQTLARQRLASPARRHAATLPPSLAAPKNIYLIGEGEICDRAIFICQDQQLVSGRSKSRSPFICGVRLHEAPTSQCVLWGGGEWADSENQPSEVVYG